MANSIFNSNPELKKNIWLELSTSRLVVMPLILAGIYFLIFLISDDNKELIQYIEWWSVGMFAVLIFLYGTRLASESVIEEVNERTWDNQRMTLISPWQMSIGKLFGSTVYAWYGGLICMVIFFINSIYTDTPVDSFRYGILILFIGIFTHSVAISLSLIGIRKNRNKVKIKSSFYFIASIVLTLYLFYYSFAVRQFSSQNLKWYFLEVDLADFGIFTILLFTAWGIIGLYRNMRTEFQFRNGPWVYTGFLITVMFYVAGFAVNISESFMKEMTLGFFFAYLVGIASTYFMIFSEPKDVVDFRLLMKNFLDRQWSELGFNIPLWMISLFSVIMITPVLVIMFLSVDVNKAGTELTFLYPISIFLFILRDLSLLLYLNLSEKSKRADVAAFLYLVVLYVLFPSILGAGKAEDLLPIFLPIPTKNILIGFLPIMVQFLIIFYLMLKRASKAKIIGIR